MTKYKSLCEKRLKQLNRIEELPISEESLTKESSRKISPKEIVEIFAKELKKYNNYYYYFVILRILLLENNGDVFKYSKNIFEIILKKFLFQKCPQEQKEHWWIFQANRRLK